jgi:hypothetical protein
MWPGGESDRFVAGGEIDVKPCDQCMDEVISSHIKSEWTGEGEVLGGTGIEVESEDRCWIGDYSFDFDCVDKWFGEGSMLQRGVIKSINIIPD